MLRPCSMPQFAQGYPRARAHPRKKYDAKKLRDLIVEVLLPSVFVASGFFVLSFG